MQSLTIKIFEATSEEGFYYEIYDNDDIDDETESIDGGLCTTTIENALEMAYVQAQAIIKASK